MDKRSARKLSLPESDVRIIREIVQREVTVSGLKKQGEYDKKLSSLLKKLKKLGA